jgi:hypothetical protein
LRSFPSVFLALACASFALQAQDAPRFALPIDCVPGESCWVVNYVDEDPTGAARDYTCGPQTYNGHTGTDIAIRDQGEMRRGVAVFAAAAGVVQATRDGVADGRFTRGDAGEVSGRECGNGVLIDHGEGWHTQYCHMRSGSIAVKKGERVERGAKLGFVGLSGRTEFPHLHFEVRHRGSRFDPFTGRAAPAPCGQPGEPFWSPEARRALGYRPVSIYDAGFAGAMPVIARLHEGERGVPARRESPVLAAWAALYHVRAGDEVVLRLEDPAGRTVLEARRTLERTQARRIEAAAARRTGDAWSAGRYRLTVRVLRAPQGQVAERVVAAELE